MDKPWLISSRLVAGRRLLAALAACCLWAGAVGLADEPTPPPPAPRLSSTDEPALLPAAAPGLAVPAGAAKPEDRYLDAYFLIQDGDTALQQSDWRTAQTKFRDALELLRELRRTAPTWNAQSIEFRIGYCTDQLDQLRDKLPVTPATAGVTVPAPAPVDELVPPPAPASAPADEPLPSPALTDAPVLAPAATSAPVAAPLPRPPPAAPAPAENATGNGAINQAELLQRFIELTAEVTRLRGEVDELKAQRVARPAPVPPAAAEARVEPPRPSVPVVAEQPEEDDEVARIERERAIESVRSAQNSGVLLKQNNWELEPSVSYSHASSNLISIDGFAILPILVIGDIQSLRVERDVFSTSLSARYGLLDNLQLDVSVPYKYERDRFVTQTQTDPSVSVREETTIEDHGLGDVSFGISHQVLYERGNLPDLILSARATAPTGESLFDLPDTPSTNQLAQSDLPLGSGVWSVRGGLTAIKSLDPVVLIFNAGYTHRFDRDLALTSIADDGSGGITTNRVHTTYQSGGTVDYGVAVAVAMNPVFAINLQLQQRITFDTELDGLGEVEGSATNEADLRFGFAWALTHNTVLNFTAAAGLTEDTPDVALSLALPVKF